MVRVLIEFRVPLPFGIEDCERAYRCANCAALELLVQSNVGCIWNDSYVVKNDDCHINESEIFHVSVPQGSYQYDYKITDLSPVYPSVFVKCLPGGKITCEEECFTHFPYIEAVSSSSIVGLQKFKCIIKTIFSDDCGTEDNIFKLSEEELNIRECYFRDITKNYGESIRKGTEIDDFYCKERNLGPLKQDWLSDPNIKKCCMYRTIDININFPGLSTIGCALLKKQHMEFGSEIGRQMVRTMNEWIRYTNEDLNERETKCQQQLKIDRDYLNTR